MALEDIIPDEPLAFKLMDSSEDKYGLTLYIVTPDTETKELWTRTIRDMLDMQGNFLKGRPCVSHMQSRAFTYKAIM